MCKKNDLVERLLECEKELRDFNIEVDSWINSLWELSIINDAITIEENDRLHGKTILDIGTDCVKPLYIALKFEPAKIIGIDEKLPSIASGIKLSSRLLTKTKISFYECNFFDEETFRKIREKERIDEDKRFDFILISKTLHHLRTGKCIVEKHKKKGCPEDEKSCIYEFKPKEIFKDLFHYGKKIVVYEYYDSTIKDDDKVRGRGGYFTRNELNNMFKEISGKYTVKLITPQKSLLDQKKPKRIDSILKKASIICFYVEEQARLMQNGG